MNWPSDWGLRIRMFVTMFLLFGLYLVFAVFLASYFGGGIWMMVVLMGGFSIAQYFFSDRLTLWSMGAKKVSPEEYPELHGMVGRLSQQADLPTPTVAVVDSAMPNAFATGRSKNHAAVCVTTGIMNTLTQDELEGVIAHELAHIKNRDMAVMTAASLLSTIAFVIVRWGWLFGGGRNGRGGNQAPIYIAILASLVVWIVSFLLIRLLSRYREYAADRGGAIITGKPSALASALLKISGRMDKVPEQDLREQAEMNAFFIVPVSKGWLANLFRTHPSTERRVERLREMERELETY